MVIVKIVGGLANQMFPYATGRRLAKVLGTTLKLDISDYAENGRDYLGRVYSLGVFNIDEQIATEEEIKALTELPVTSVERAFRKVFRKKPRRPAGYVKEKGYTFDPHILSLPDDVYLRGNWNSPKYFSDVTSLIRQEFTFRAAATGRNLELAEEIQAGNSVSLHVRRGDYVANSNTNQIFGACGLDYYYRCIDFLTQTISNPYFFVFSDDADWVRNNLQLKYPVAFVDHNDGDHGYEDLRLMSQCRHHIIANSGFSWWGAWLNSNAQKIVCAPKNWFVSSKYDTRDLIPESWIRL